MRGTLLLAALLLISATPGMGQGDGRPATPEEGKELYAELRTTYLNWAQEELLPQLREWKGMLDAAMTPEDLAALNELRAKATVLRKETREMLITMKDAWNGENYEEMGEYREVANRLKERRNELGEELRPIAIRYIPALKEIGAVAKDEVREWKKEAKRIFFDWMEEHREALIESEGNGQGFGRGGLMKFLDKFDPDLKKKIIVARFMLWDGGNFVRDLQEHGTNTDILKEFDFR